MSIHVDSTGGHFSVGVLSVCWGNAEDPFFAGERLEGFLSISAGATSLEFGCIDQDRPGIYLTKYKDGDVESTTALIQF